MDSYKKKNPHESQLRLRKVPVILLNARLVQDTTAVAGVMLRNFRAFEGTLLPVFHLEQFDPEDDKETFFLGVKHR